MIIKEIFNVTVNHIFGQSDETPYEVVEIYRRTWEEIIDEYSEFTFELDDKIIEVSINWGSVRKRLQKVETMSGKGKLVINLSTDNLRVPYNPRVYLSHFLALILHDIFLTANLAAPGCLDFYGAKYNSSTPEIGGRFMHELHYSSIFLNWAWTEIAEKYQWPVISRIPLREVIKWHKSLNIQARQIAEKSIERTLFALVHFCSEPSASPNTLLWLMHALEAIYDTPKEAISQVLKRRIELTLGVPSTHSQVLRKEINKLYEVRSTFVHGDFDIHHPVKNERLDGKLDDYTLNQIEKNQFACAIVIATLQNMILHNWTELTFKEVLANG